MSTTRFEIRLRLYCEWWLSGFSGAVRNDKLRYKGAGVFRAARTDVMSYAALTFQYSPTVSFLATTAGDSIHVVGWLAGPSGAKCCQSLWMSYPFPFASFPWTRTCPCCP